MNWNEMKKKALENGFEFLKHGSRHDLYINKKNRQNHPIGTPLVTGSQTGFDEQTEKRDWILVLQRCFRKKKDYDSKH